MFDANGQYVGLGKRRGRAEQPPTAPAPLPLPTPAPSPAIAADLHASLQPFLSLSSCACPCSFAQWLSLPPALLSRHLRNTREVALLQRIACHAAQLDGLVQRLYDAIVEGESIEHAQRHLPHRCPALPDPLNSALPSDSSESSASSSSSDSSVPPAEHAERMAALAASLAPFFHCFFPAAHSPSFPSSLLSAVGDHVRSIGGVFVELTAALLELESGLGELQSFQQLNGRLSEELQAEGCDALAATKAAVAELEGSLVDRLTALLSATLSHQRQPEPEQHTDTSASRPVVPVTGADTTSAGAERQPVSVPPASDAAVTAPSIPSTPAPAQPSASLPLPPPSPTPSVASSSSFSSASSSATSSSSLSPNTRLDVILGLQPAAAAKRHIQPAAQPVLSEEQDTAPQQHEQGRHASDGEQCEPTVKRARTDSGMLAGAEAREAHGTTETRSGQGHASLPASMRVLFTSAADPSSDGAAAQCSVPDSPQLIAAAPSADAHSAPTAPLDSDSPTARPASPSGCDMQLSLPSSASSSAAPASPSSCPPSPLPSPRMSASQPAPAAAPSTARPLLTRLQHRSHSISQLIQAGSRCLRGPSERENAAAVYGGAAAGNVDGTAALVPRSPGSASSAAETDEGGGQHSGAAGTQHTAAAEAVRAPTRTVSLTRCSQERVDVAGMTGVDAEGGADEAMHSVDTDRLQLHSSQPQAMV